jgi:hypothetical protein
VNRKGSSRFASEKFRAAAIPAWFCWSAHNPYGFCLVLKKWRAEVAKNRLENAAMLLPPEQGVVSWGKMQRCLPQFHLV